MKILNIAKFVFHKLDDGIQRQLYLTYIAAHSPLFFVNERKQIKSAFAKELDLKRTGLSADSLVDWKRTFLKLWWITPKLAAKSASHFCNDVIECCKMMPEKHNDPYPALICVVKNDLLCIKIMLDHYRQIGVKNFIFVDNGSDWICTQNIRLKKLTIILI